MTPGSGSVRRTAAIAAILLLTSGCGDALAWGCEGHRVVAMLAERLLGPAVIAAVTAVLTASPVDPDLKRGCEPLPADVIADVAAWADDQRAADPSTAGWHFVNFPLAIGAPAADYRPYCVGGNCVIDALVTQYRTLTTSSDKGRRADALRFVIHLVGDLHQPLHAITNGDRGGNCLPVSYFGQPAREDDRGNFSPNLHSVWDSGTIRRWMIAHRLADSKAVADDLASHQPLPARAAPAAATPGLVASWAREANALGRRVAYGRLARVVPPEPATPLTLASCEDNRDVAHRLLALRERVDGSYERTSVPVIVSQLRLAGIRLAQLLNAAFPLS